jgi:hypothetical protein
MRVPSIGTPIVLGRGVVNVSHIRMFNICNRKTVIRGGLGGCCDRLWPNSQLPFTTVYDRRRRHHHRHRRRQHHYYSATLSSTP